jgi:hypothetical protein
MKADAAPSTWGHSNRVSESPRENAADPWSPPWAICVGVLLKNNKEFTVLPLTAAMLKRRLDELPIFKRSVL